MSEVISCIYEIWGKKKNGKQVYSLVFKGKTLKTSIYREKLEKIVEEINNGLVVVE